MSFILRNMSIDIYSIYKYLYAICIHIIELKCFMEIIFNGICEVSAEFPCIYSLNKVLSIFINEFIYIFIS